MVRSKKTVLLHINNKNIKPGSTELIICDHTVKSSESARFLGIIIDYKLSFVPHIKSIIQKCTVRSNIIKFLCSVKWGSDPSTLLILYKSFVRSIIDYGSFIYYPKAKIHCELLDKLQLSCLRPSMGYKKTTPNNIVLAESKFQSILERSRFLGKSYLSKVMSNSSLPIYNTIYQTNVNLSLKPRLFIECISEMINLNIKSQKHYNIYCFDYNIITTSINVNTELGFQLKKAKEPNTILNDYLLKKNSHALYTDGSKNTDQNSSVGLAVYYTNLNITSGLTISKNA